MMAFAAVLTSSGLAATVTLTLNGSSNGNGLGGGSYTASGTGLSTAGYAAISHPASAAPDTFQTFCLEFTEHFSSGALYNYTVGTAATLGGAGGAVNGADPISKGTAYLYSNFAAGSLSGFDYGAGRKTSNNQLQLAFWYFENEIGAIPGYSGYNWSSNPFITLANYQFGSSAFDNADGAFGVKVLNLTSNNGTHAQSQLYASAPLNVPDTGATVVLFGLTLAGLVGFKRFSGRRA